MEELFTKSKINIIENFSKQKRFSSFLPAISGIDGKPTWVFYVNSGQCIASFGVDNKDTPLIPFESAVLAYQNVPLKCFRTLIFVDGKLYQPFLDEGKTKLEILNSSIRIFYENSIFEVEITYSTTNHISTAGLIRKVRITNKANEKHRFDVVDGLPIFLPKGISNYMYHELTTLAASYCECSLHKNSAWYFYKNRGEDNSQFVQKEDGSGFICFAKDNEPVEVLVDPKSAFGNDESFLNPLSFADIENNSKNQMLSNQIPSAFVKTSKVLEKGESIEFISLFGSFDNFEKFIGFPRDFSFSSLEKMIEDGEKLVDDLLPKIDTNNKKVDAYLRQSFLDNGLRGGFPLLVKNKPLYLYSRKHGDLERDYNSFAIPSNYFSSGYGNYRDINQNRRNDLIIEPLLKDKNIFLFTSLIEQNGFNPLQVDMSLLDKNFDSFDEALNSVLNKKDDEINANYVEGYWIDHWTYNTDLIENYIAVYPDKVDELFNVKKYRFFDSGIRIKDRSERYVKTEFGVRQYSCLEKIANHKSNWLCDSNNKIIEVSLFSKLFDLILKKVTTLDVDQMGLEMLADKPGWNDSCNGLPGIFGSSMCESIELLRLIKLFKKIYSQNDFKIELTEASFSLLNRVFPVKSLGFSLWREQNDAREIFEKEYRNKTKLVNVEKSTAISFLDCYEKILTDGIKKAINLGKGIIPTYFSHELDKFKEENGVIVPLAFSTKVLPYFLEGPTRLMKLGRDFFKPEMLDLIKESDLFDKNLGIFKTSVSLKDVSKEVGRVCLFEAGWLERESDFLHMTFKFLLGLLYSGYHKEFFELAKTNLPCFMDPKIYGRPVFENVSFIVPSNHVNKKEVGSGHYARLTGANTEVINMYQLLFFGKNVFVNDNGVLRFNITPHIPLSLFNENYELSVSLFGITTKFINKNCVDYDSQKVSKILIDDMIVDSELILALRERKIYPKQIQIIIE